MHVANGELWRCAFVCDSKSSLQLSVSWRRGAWGPCCAGWAGSWTWEASGSRCGPPSQKTQRQQVQVGRACFEAAGRVWPYQVLVWPPARLAPPPRCLHHTPSSSAEVCCSTCNNKCIRMHSWVAYTYCIQEFHILYIYCIPYTVGLTVNWLDTNCFTKNSLHPPCKISVLLHLLPYVVQYSIRTVIIFNTV